MTPLCFSPFCDLGRLSNIGIPTPLHRGSIFLHEGGKEYLILSPRRRNLYAELRQKFAAKKIVFKIIFSEGDKG